MHVKTFVRTAVAVGAALILWPLGAAALEPLAVYENWSQSLIRRDRWQGGEGFGGQEVKRVIAANALSMRYRRQGFTSSNTGNTNSFQFLNLANPAQVNELEATFTVTDLTMPACAGNNVGATTRSRVAQVNIAPFNDGTSSGPGDRTGDYSVGVQAFRDGSSPDAVGVLRVSGFVNRCTNAACSTGTSTTIASINLASVTIGQTFTLRAKWDQPNHQFLVGLDASADFPLSYSVSDTAPAINRFANIGVNHTTANCAAGAVAVDSTTSVGTVKTNSSAVIP